ncbi:MAG: hypothetical protein LBT89_06385 [Planctomycetaceae bacterium]|nr:hypothetical protein [Planctomycetaceae bacterium]
MMEAIPQDICNGKPLLMDKAYEGNACRKKARKCKMKPVVPPKQNRRYKWRL